MAILAVGSVAYDTVETPAERRERQLGGSASYFALAAAPLAPVRVVGAVGDDFRPADLELMAARGADLGGIVRLPGPTFHWSGRYHADLIERDTLATELGVFADFAPVIPPAWRDTPYLFLGNIHPALQAGVLAQLRRPRLVVTDTMNFWIQGARQDLEVVLAGTDVLLVNDSEARLLSGRWGLADAAAAIHALGPARVVVKKGEHGALYFGPEGVLAVPALLLPRVVDPTGAGDAFAGGFLGSLAAAGADAGAGDALFRRAMLDGTVTASFCPEGFSVEGLLRADASARSQRLESLLAMMRP
jgi:sugar/nucleoside kinase (ribokinase family)